MMTRAERVALIALLETIHRHWKGVGDAIKGFIDALKGV